MRVWGCGWGWERATTIAISSRLRESSGGLILCPSYLWAGQLYSVITSLYIDKWMRRNKSVSAHGHWTEAPSCIDVAVGLYHQLVSRVSLVIGDWATTSSMPSLLSEEFPVGQWGLSLNLSRNHGSFRKNGRMEESSGSTQRSAYSQWTRGVSVEFLSHWPNPAIVGRSDDDVVIIPNSIVKIESTTRLSSVFLS